MKRKFKGDPHYPVQKYLALYLFLCCVPQCTLSPFIRDSSHKVYMWLSFGYLSGKVWFTF